MDSESSQRECFQGFETDLTGGPDGWSTTFLKTRAIGGVEVVGSVHNDKPWRAVQRASWEALTRKAPLDAASDVDCDVLPHSTG